MCRPTLAYRVIHAEFKKYIYSKTPAIGKLQAAKGRKLAWFCLHGHYQADTPLLDQPSAIITTTGALT